MKASRKSRSTSRGFTLIELLVYVVVASLAVTIAGRVWYDATVTNSDTRKRISMSRDMQDLLFFMEEDVARLGAKVTSVATSSSGALSSGAAAATWNRAEMDPRVYMDTTAGTQDSSSFRIGDGGALDTLRFRSLAYDTTGASTGYEEVAYWVASGQLLRSVSRWDTAGAVVTVDSAVVLADSVTGFNVSAGVYQVADGVGDTVFKASTPTRLSGGNTAAIALHADGRVATLTGFGRTLPGTADRSELIRFADSLTAGVVVPDSLVAGSTYRIELWATMDSSFADHFNAPSRLDQAGDTLSLLVVQPSSGLLVPGVDTLYFFAGQAGISTRYLYDITPATTFAPSTVGLRFRYSLTSDLDPSGTGTPALTFDRLAIYRLDAGTYAQVDAPTVAQKERSKSLDLTLTVRRSDFWQNNGSRLQTFRKIIRIPNNGPLR